MDDRNYYTLSEDVGWAGGVGAERGTERGGGECVRGRLLTAGRGIDH